MHLKGSINSEHRAYETTEEPRKELRDRWGRLYPVIRICIKIK